MRKLNKEQAAKIWDILVEHAGANNDINGFNKYAFVETVVEDDFSEYRFCGFLGFGGKFWNNSGKIYINCYREDETPKHREIIDKVNKLLENI